MRLFGREADNQHKEPLGMARLAAAALRRLLEAEDAGNSGLRAAARRWLAHTLQVHFHSRSFAVFSRSHEF